MDMTTIMGWVVWVLAALIVLIWLANFVKKLLIDHDEWGWTAIVPWAWGILALVITAATDFSKFHLLWLIPMGILFPLAIALLEIAQSLSGMRGAFKDMMESMKVMAEEVERQKDVYSNPLDYVEARPGDFENLDLEWYDRARSELEAVGFRYLGDLESRTLTRVYPQMRTMVRVLVSDDETIQAGFFHIQAFDGEGNLFGDFRTYDFETMFADGTFLSSGNCEGVNMDESCEGIELHKYPPQTPWEDLLRRHKEIESERTVSDGKTPATVSTLAEVMDAQEKSHVLRSKAKQEEWAEEDEYDEDFDDEEDYDDDFDDDDEESPRRRGGKVIDVE